MPGEGRGDGGFLSREGNRKKECSVFRFLRSYHYCYENILTSPAAYILIQP